MNLTKQTENETWLDYRTSKPFGSQRTDIMNFPENAIVELSDMDRSKMLNSALRITANPYKIEEREEFIREAKGIAAHLSTSSNDKITTELTTGFGAVMISGLPVDEDLPDTPAKGGSLSPNYKKTFVAEAVLIALGEITKCEAFNFRQDGLGTAPLIDNVVPVPNLKIQKGAGGFANNFPFHCESAWHRKRPDYLILVGIREASDAKTLAFSAERLKGTKWDSSNLGIDNWFRLRAPELYIQMEDSGIPMGTANTKILPPIQIDQQRIKLNINFNGIDCANQEAIDWLFELEQFVESNSVGTVISPGNAIILNNYTTCHTRTGYSPSFQGNDRWFVRGYFKNSLWEVDPVLYYGEENWLDKEAMQDLINLNWMDSQGKLTDEFSKFVYNPQEIQKLSIALRRLVTIAFNYTPILGERIV